MGDKKIFMYATIGLLVGLSIGWLIGDVVGGSRGDSIELALRVVGSGQFDTRVEGFRTTTNKVFYPTSVVLFSNGCEARISLMQVDRLAESDENAERWLGEYLQEVLREIK